jgi:hypothetical protein
LKFVERGGRRRTIGEIRLRREGALTIGASEFGLFRAQGSSNYCLPKLLLAAHYMYRAQARWRSQSVDEIRPRACDERAMFVTFIRPHPVWLACLGDRTSGNIFPVNLVGDLGEGRVGLALRERRMASNVVERAGCIALSGVPLARCPVAFRLAGNHRKESIDWTALEFETVPSPVFGIPIPAFATRFRELKIETVHQAGSHRFFIARTVSDAMRAGDPQACIVHGFYEYWRVRGDKIKLKRALIEDAINKRGCIS